MAGAESLMRPAGSERRLRVLMVTGAYYPEISSGGVQSQNMARELRDRADVHVLTTAVDPALRPDDEINGVPVTRVFVNVRSALSRFGAAVSLIVSGLRLVKQADVVHIHGCSTKNVPLTIIAKMFRRPIILTLHTAGYDEPEAVERQGSLALWAFLSADRYMSVSPSLVAAYRAFGLPADRMDLVPNGIDTDRFSPAADRAALRRELGLPNDRPVVAFVGFFSEDKQPQVLFDAWLQLQNDGVDTTLLLVGDNDSGYFEVNAGLARDMRDRAEAAGLADRLVMTGRVLDVERYLQAADVFVLPSRREGLPVALLEAMSCGLPCVASCLAGSTDSIITNADNGILVSAGDVTALANAITAVVADRPTAERLGRAARATILSRYGSADIAGKWMDCYARLMRALPLAS